MKKIKILRSKFIRYALGGGLGACIDIGCLYLFTDICNIHYLISSIGAFCISVSFGFFFQKYVTFQDYQKKYLMQGFKFALFQGGGQLINMFLLRLLVEKFGGEYLTIALFNKVIIFIRNFVMNQFFNFTSSPSQ